MKTIISTEYLKRSIQKALSLGLKAIKFQNNEILFFCKNERTIEMIVAKELEIDKSILVTADVIQWYKIYRFLKNLPEQPIVMEIDNYSDTEISIKLSQFIAKF